MTVSSTTSRWEYIGDGSTTDFTYNNRIFDDSDLDVYVDGSLQTLGTDYTITGAGTSSGGEVQFVSAPANDAEIVIIRDVANTQGSDYPLGGPLPSATLESDIDRRTVISQDQQKRIDRTIKFPDTEQNSPSGELPSKSGRANKYVAFDGNGELLVQSGTTDDVDVADKLVTASGGSAQRTLADHTADLLSVRGFGAEGDGTTDDRAAFASADSSGDFYVTRGTYVIGSDITISNDVYFGRGAILKPSSGVTVTIDGEVDAPGWQPIFAGEGDVVLNTTGVVCANWWIANGSSTTPNTDFAQRWNEMWANCPNAHKMKLVGDQTLSSPVNMTGWNDAVKGYRVLEATGAKLAVEHSGDIVLDTVDSAEIILRDWDALTSGANTPKACLVRGRQTSDEAIGHCVFDNVRLRGSYTVATLLLSHTELNEFNSCIFNNGHTDVGGDGYPSRILTSEALGSFGVSSAFTTVSTTSALSANKNIFRKCRAQNVDNPDAATGANNKGSCTIVRGDGGHVFKDDFTRCTGFSAYHVDCSASTAPGVRFEGIWSEAQGGSTAPLYTVSVFGGDNNSTDASGLFVDIFSDQPRTNGLIVDGVGRIRSLDYKGAYRNASNLNHGAVIQSASAVDSRGTRLRQGFGGDIDLSGINSGLANLDIEVFVQNFSDFVAPTEFLKGEVRVASEDENGLVHVTPGESSVFEATDRSFRPNNIADDDVHSFTPRSPRGICYVDSFDLRFACAFMYEAVNGGGQRVVSLGVGALGAVTTGALTGTSGADGNLTCSTANDGKIYVENRTGSGRGVSIRVISML